MANTFEWHLGFDFDSLPLPHEDDPNNNLFYIQNGFVKITSTDAVPGTPFVLNRDDTISFKVFNLTNGATTSSDFSITNGEIAFQKAITTDSSQAPFDDLPLNSDGHPAITISSFPQTEVNSEKSAIFSPDVEIPAWDITDSKTVEHDGKFFFTVKLTIQGPDEESREFRVDPEMVVGTGTMGDDGEL